MEAKIKEVNDYFVQKILNGKFEVKQSNQYTVQVVIDSKYNFSVWLANGWVSIHMHGSSLSISFMDLRFSDIEKQKVYDRLHPHLKKELTQEEKEKLEYERLKAKFERNK